MPRINRRRTRRIRKSAATPGYDGSREIASRTVEDPYDPGNTIVVPANLRHDPLLRMFQRREVDAAQLKAGELLRECHEAASANGLKAINLLAERVDGGNAHAGISDRAIRAARRLHEAEVLLGWQGYRIVTSVVPAASASAPRWSASCANGPAGSTTRPTSSSATATMRDDPWRSP